MFMREKQIKCGKNYMEVDIIPGIGRAIKLKQGEKKRKEKLIRPSQVNLNEKNSKRYMKLLAHGNFTRKDLALVCTYNVNYAPKTIEEAEKEIRNYLRRVAYEMKKQGVGPLKYILVTEFKEDEEGNFVIKPHHHLIINGGLDRDKLESLWSKKIKGQPKEQMGWINAKRLQFDGNGNGIEGLVKYMNKPYKKKSWSSSRNLKRPETTPDDRRYKKRKIDQLAVSNDLGEEFFSKKYPNYDIVSIVPKFNKHTDRWHIYLKMWKKDRKKKYYG